MKRSKVFLRSELRRFDSLESEFRGNTLHFTATGSPGATGCFNVTTPKSAVPNINNLMVFVNGTKLSGSSLTITMNATDYFVYFCLTFHSIYNINITLAAAAPLPPQLPLVIDLLIAPVAYALRRRQMHPRRPAQG